MPEEQEAFLVEQFTLEEAINYLIYIESLLYFTQSTSKKPMKKNREPWSSPQ